MTALTNAALADMLDILQQKENDGKGVFCVKSIIYYLRFDARPEAELFARFDYDKICKYPEIEQLLVDEGVCVRK